MKTLFRAFWALVLAPLLIPLSRLRTPAVPPRIIIVQPGKLGDLLCTTSLMRAIKTAHPDWEVHVVCRSGSSQALAGNPFVTADYAIDKLSRRALIGQLRNLRATAIINCMPGAFSSMLGLFALIPIRINTFSSSHGILVHLLTVINTHNIRYTIGTWTHAHYMKLLERLDIAPVSAVPDFLIPDDARKAMEQWRRDHGLQEASYVVCNITAGNAVKEWPEEKFAELICAIVEKMDVSVLISTADKGRAASLLKLLQGVSQAMDASGLSLAESAALYADSAAFVSADTGPLYLAYSTGVPLVVMLGPVHPEEQVPRESPTVAHVPPPPTCEPWVFVSLTPREGTAQQLRCARDISVQRVFDALGTVLNASKETSQ